jgi:hypothetical protein
MRIFDPIRATPLGALIKTAFMKVAGVDAAIVGFPKCGNTWYSALIRHLLIERYGLDCSKMGRLFVSDLGLWPFFKLPHVVPRIYQSHCMPFPSETELRGMKESLAALSDVPMVILIREHKDALVSYFMHLAYRDPGAPYSGSIADFVRSPIFGVEKFVKYYNSLIECRMAGQAPTILRSYEDLWFDAPGALDEDCRFFGIDGVRRDLLLRIVDACSFQNMRKMELTATQETTAVPGLFRSHNEHLHAFKVRKGGVGNWRENLSLEDAAYLDAYVNSHLSLKYRSLRPKGHVQLRA